MRVGSHKDVVRWFRHPWLKPTVIVAALTWMLWQAVRWAIAPGFWGGSWLHNESDTALKLANDMFGPVLLVKWWIQDPPGAWGDKWAVLHQWGQYETAARLLLIIAILWVVICCFLFRQRLRSTKSAESSQQLHTEGEANQR